MTVIWCFNHRVYFQWEYLKRIWCEWDLLHGMNSNYPQTPGKRNLFMHNSIGIAFLSSTPFLSGRKWREEMKALHDPLIWLSRHGLLGIISMSVLPPGHKQHKKIKAKQQKSVVYLLLVAIQTCLSSPAAHAARVLGKSLKCVSQHTPLATLGGFVCELQ